ncbi:hypothetical protein NQ314_008795 [Rhamnusium bicolor]|uniref:FGF n=1 Tax=Rhamnusium bicolor TaxID=1586634 RepID=A0AAV8Y7C2_9CUCU|nr:hypothetical protein NQ314_008795 [Rhamnusium bicolor]
MGDANRPFGYRMQLFSQTGYNLTIRANGEILGTQDDSDQDKANSDPSNGGTVFIEEFQGSYSAYKSALYPEWYIGIKKNGLPKKGFRTKYGQKAVKFLPRRH